MAGTDKAGTVGCEVRAAPMADTDTAGTVGCEVRAGASDAEGCGMGRVWTPALILKSLGYAVINAKLVYEVYVVYERFRITTISVN